MKRCKCFIGLDFITQSIRPRWGRWSAFETQLVKIQSIFVAWHSNLSNLKNKRFSDRNMFCGWVVLSGLAEGKSCASVSFIFTWRDSLTRWIPWGSRSIFFKFYFQCLVTVSNKTSKSTSSGWKQPLFAWKNKRLMSVRQRLIRIKIVFSQKRIVAKTVNVAFMSSHLLAIRDFPRISDSLKHLCLSKVLNAYGTRYIGVFIYSGSIQMNFCIEWQNYSGFLCISTKSCKNL